MANSDMQPYSEFLPHDAPAGVVDFVEDALRDEQESQRLTMAEWEQIVANKPELRRYIADAAHQLAPEDAAMRQEITRCMLGLFVIDHETRINEQLEQLLTLEAAAEPAAGESFWQRRRAQRQAARQGRRVGVGVVAASLLLFRHSSAGGGDAARPL